MKTKFTMILTLFMALIVQLTFAQQKTVTDFQQHAPTMALCVSVFQKCESNLCLASKPW